MPRSRGSLHRSQPRGRGSVHPFYREHHVAVPIMDQFFEPYDELVVDATASKGDPISAKVLVTCNALRGTVFVGAEMHVARPDFDQAGKTFQSAKHARNVIPLVLQHERLDQGTYAAVGSSVASDSLSGALHPAGGQAFEAMRCAESDTILAPWLQERVPNFAAASEQEMESPQKCVP